MKPEVLCAVVPRMNHMSRHAALEIMANEAVLQQTFDETDGYNEMAVLRGIPLRPARKLMAMVHTKI